MLEGKFPPLAAARARHASTYSRTHRLYSPRASANTREWRASWPATTAASSPRAPTTIGLQTLARVRRAGHHGLQRRHHRHGRGSRGPLSAAAPARDARSASRKRARSTCWCGSKGRRSPTVPPEDPLELVRTIATARILMPRRIVRLSAGRLSLTDEAQALCFLAGANSVFLGDRLLTTPNPGRVARRAAARAARHAPDDGARRARRRSSRTCRACTASESPSPACSRVRGSRDALERVARGARG